ncbi:MAG: Sir2 family NAD-dependent protein deacetylase, partial [Bacteroidota bacterium]
QNVDNLHELAGSSEVLHLHGRLDQACSVKEKQHVISMKGDINLGDKGEDGEQLRPNIVWFGESVPNIVPAAELASEADVFIIVGTSLVVYPAASLMEYAPLGTPIYVVDPTRPSMHSSHHIEFIEEPATTGVPKLVERLLK